MVRSRALPAGQGAAEAPPHVSHTAGLCPPDKHVVQSAALQSARIIPRELKELFTLWLSPPPL
jgi:hypothetical protein